MLNVRKMIVNRMKLLGWTPYRLAKEVRGHMSAPTVYDYVSGRGDMRGAQLGRVMDAMGLTITETPSKSAQNVSKSVSGKSKRRATGETT